MVDKNLISSIGKGILVFAAVAPGGMACMVTEKAITETECSRY